MPFSPTTPGADAAASSTCQLQRSRPTGWNRRPCGIAQHTGITADVQRGRGGVLRGRARSAPGKGQAAPGDASRHGVPGATGHRAACGEADSALDTGQARRSASRQTGIAGAGRRVPSLPAAVIPGAGRRGLRIIGSGAAGADAPGPGTWGSGAPGPRPPGAGPCSIEPIGSAYTRPACIRNASPIRPMWARRGKIRSVAVPHSRAESAGACHAAARCGFANIVPGPGGGVHET